MQERRNIRRLLLFGVTVMLTVVVYILQQRRSSPVVDPALFKVEGLDHINHVELKGAANTVKLDYDGSRWKVNDRYDADLQRITVFFATLEKALPKRPVAAAMRDSVRKMLLRQGVEVSLLEGQTVQKKLIVGANEQRSESYFMLDGSQEPYVVTIPGYRVQVSQIFELGENDWRDRRIFGFRWQNFKSLSLSFARDKTGDFVIEKEANEIRLKGEPQADTSRIFSYLDDVSLLVADQIFPPGFSARYDSLAATPPIASMEIRDIADRVYSLRLFQPLRDESSVLGVMQQEDRVLFERKKLFPIVKKRTYFRSSPQQK